ncbi:unnamed protein product [Aureobasidium mustum]|uniref:DNA2/NAM7 helicase-like C-terminal domain-containing protein n=1 Tax=Aureobasidium mustum TaxID=2773714 RepID=A0A9N8K1T8_9PEZI|nr:unnamed protein product [Aureobasidium mustum]
MAAELKYRKHFKLADDVKLDSSQVKMFVSVDEEPVNSDSDSESEEVSEPKHESQPDNTTSANITPNNSQPLEKVVALLPMAGQDNISDQNRLVRIQNPSAKSDDWNKVGISQKFRCNVRITKPNESRKKVPYLPSDNSKKNGVAMNFSIKSHGLAPKLSLSVEYHRNEHALSANEIHVPRHEGSIDFSFGHVYKDANDTSTEPNQIMNLEVKYGSEHKSALVEFNTTGAIADSLKCINDYPEPHLHPRVKRMRPRGDEVKLTKKLVSLTRILENEVYHVSIKIQPNSKDIDAHKAGNRNSVDDLLDMLPHKNNLSAGPAVSDNVVPPSAEDTSAATPPEGQTVASTEETPAAPLEDRAVFPLSVEHAMTVLPYEQYRNAIHKPLVQHGKMPTPSTVFDKHHPCLPMPALPVFRDADEGSIVISNSAHTQSVEREFILKALAIDPHKVQLLTLGDAVLLAVRWDKRLRAGLSSDERITYPNGTIIDFKIHSAQALEAAANNPKPHYAKGLVIGNSFGVSCDMLCLVLKKKAVEFAGMTSPLHSASNAASYHACLSSQSDDHVCASIINAAATTYARGSWVTEQWPVLLNDGGVLPTRDYISQSRCSPDEWTDAFRKLKEPKGKPWNRRQIQFIDTFLKAQGGMALCTGPGGAGKTELMMQLIAFVLRTGSRAVVTGMKHDTLDMIVEKFVEMFPEMEPPLRAYTPSSEDLMDEKTTWVTTDDREMLILEMARTDLNENKDRRSHLKMTYSIQHKVIQNSTRTDMPPMVKQIPSGLENGVSVFNDPTQYDYRQIFREGFAALPEHSPSDSEYWTEDRARLFKYVYAVLRAEAIQNAPFLVSTMVGLKNREISQNFSLDHNIARFDDEAQACEEGVSLIGAALCHWSKNVKTWAMFGDYKQSGVICLTGQGQENTVDVFHEQSRISLFSRLEKAGHPVVHLNTQQRLPQLFFTPLNELHYDMQITTSSSLKRPLRENTTLLGEIAGRSQKEIALQTDAQRRMLLVQVDSPTMKARDSPSRANPGFAAYVVDVVLPALQGVVWRLFYKLRRDGWSRLELPKLYTIDTAHGREADFVIFDVVNDTREGFLSDKTRMCLAASRAKQQMLWVTGDCSEIPTDTKTKYYRDSSDGDKIKQVTVSRPLLHWKKYFEDKKCTHQTAPPAFEVPTDLAYFGDDLDTVKVETGTSGEVSAPIDDSAQFSTGDAAVWPAGDALISGEDFGGDFW